MADKQQNSSNREKLRESTEKLSEEQRNKSLEGVLNREEDFSVWQVGKKLQKNPKYQIIKKLGEGGFGITYLAEDTSNNKSLVVIKTLRKDLQNKPDFDFTKSVKDIANEALRLAKCKHDNIVGVIEIISEEEMPCIVMEYIEGKSLDEWVKKTKEFIPQEKAIDYIKQIGNALICAHSQEPPILHRDVKPNNIIIQENKSKAVLIDFGIARHLNPDDPFFTTLTTVGYAPIEQYYLDEPQHFYTDVYGLAATLYFVLTKTDPQDAKKRLLDVAKSKVDTLIPPKNKNSKIKDWVNDAILKGMRLYAEERPQSIQEWFNLLSEPEDLDGDFIESNLPSTVPQKTWDEESNILTAEPPEKKHSNILELLWRTAFMAAGIWLLAIALFKAQGDPPFGIGVLVGVSLVVIAQVKNRSPLDQKIYQLIIAGLPTVGMLLAISPANLSFSTVWWLTIAVSGLAILMMFIFQQFITGD